MSDYPPEHQAGGAAQRPGFSGRASVPGPPPPHPDGDHGHGAYGGSGVHYPETWIGGSGASRPAAGRATVAGAAPVRLAEAAAAKRGGGTPADPVKAKKRKRRKRLVVGLAVILILTGFAFIGGTYYFTAVPLPGEFAPNQITRIYSADNQLIGQVGDENRTVVDFSEISQPMKDAMIAAEDRSFYKNSGVDFKGTARAMWNNVTGGDQQGGSTITQQYARIASKLSQEASYSRKAKEAFIAMKLSREYSKEDILNFYLNTVDFGRGAQGIQSAAQAYFGINAKELTAEQAAVIAGMVKSPGGYYEPDEHLDRVKDRWAYVMNSMVETGALTKEQRDKAVFPTIKPFTPVGEFWQKPVYQIVKYVKEEMAALGRSNLATGGYTIHTSIDMRVQAQAEKAAASVEKGNPMRGQNPLITAALVATEPATGRVLAYYGGPEGAGSDYAGYRKTDEGQITGEGFHPPGSTAKVYVLAEALKQGYAVNSLWDGTSPKEFPESGRTKGNPVTNSGGAQPCGNHCTIRQATVNSLNTPFFGMTEKLKASTVLDMMRQAGVHYMTPAVPADGSIPANIDVTKSQLSELVPSKFNTEIGIGQYPVTVLQQSAGFATFANNGTSVQQHFITKVAQGKDVIHEDKAPAKKQVVTPEVAAAMGDVLKDIHANQGALRNGRVAAAKTGTWEVDNNRPDENGDVWIAGYTPQIASAVWVGSKKDRVPLYTNTTPDQPYSDKAHRRMMYGADLPGAIWKQFMEGAHEALKLKNVPFPPARPIGDPEQTGNGVAPSPTASPSPSSSDASCPFPPFCSNGRGRDTADDTRPTTKPSPDPEQNPPANEPEGSPGLLYGTRMLQRRN